MRGTTSGTCLSLAKSWKGNGLVTDMERHMMVNHGGPKICKHCRKMEFSSDKEFKDHELWCYSNSVPVECNQCGEKFANRITLVAHRDSVHRGPLIHSDVLGHICPYCGKGYKQSAVLYRHKLSCPMNSGKL